MSPVAPVRRTVGIRRSILDSFRTLVLLYRDAHARPAADERLLLRAPPGRGDRPSSREAGGDPELPAKPTVLEPVRTVASGSSLIRWTSIIAMRPRRPSGSRPAPPCRCRASASLPRSRSATWSVRTAIAFGRSDGMPIGLEPAAGCPPSQLTQQKRVAWRRHAALLDRLRDVPCDDCGRRLPTCAMDFDHRDESAKSSGVTRLSGAPAWRASWPRSPSAISSARTATVLGRFGVARRCAPSGSSSVGGAPAFQAGCRGFEPRLPLQFPFVGTAYRVVAGCGSASGAATASRGSARMRIPPSGREVMPNNCFTSTPSTASRS